jgi:hypothetical protein
VQIVLSKRMLALVGRRRRGRTCRTIYYLPMEVTMLDRLLSVCLAAGCFVLLAKAISIAAGLHSWAN